MRFRLVHLMLATAFVAIFVMASDRYLNQSVMVEFKTRELPPYPGDLFNESEYALAFTIHYDQYPIGGLVGDSFGFNPVLGLDVDTKNVAMLDGRKVYLRHRKHSLPWLPASRIEDQIECHFDVILVFPNAEEWRAERNSPEGILRHRQWKQRVRKTIRLQ